MEHVGLVEETPSSLEGSDPTIMQKETTEIPTDGLEHPDTVDSEEALSSRQGHPEASLKTSDFYKMRSDVPERFNHPGLHS